MLSLSTDAAARQLLSRGEIRWLRARIGRMVRAAALSDGLTAMQLSARLCGDDEVQALNRDYRGKDRPTDVLAFAQREGPGGHLHPELLGDVVISVGAAQRQAAGALADEVLFLASHGLCHLLGYEHNDDAQEMAMNQRMRALLDESARRGKTRAA